jgi:hypothetical protein
VQLRVKALAVKLLAVALHVKLLAKALHVKLLAKALLAKLPKLQADANAFQFGRWQQMLSPVVLYLGLTPVKLDRQAI